jgi:LPXTG-motif cell wall-anchored protein
MHTGLASRGSLPAADDGKALANTGADSNTLLLWALMLFGAGMVFTFLARRRV